MKKTLCLLLSCLMLVGAATAFAEPYISTPLGEMPFTTEDITLRVLISQDTLIEDYETNLFTKYIEDNTGVKLDFELLPASRGEALNKVTVMLASGQKLPDVINFNMDLNTVSVLSTSGAFKALDEFIGVCTPNFDAINERYPEYELLKYSKAADGHVYSLPQHAGGVHDSVPSKLVMNRAWLEALDLSVPTTTEEFYSVLKAFKENDPNGNGVADEYPLIGSTVFDPAIFVMNAFTYDDGDQHIQISDGKLDVAYTTEEWREGLRYMHKLYEEELIAPISYTQDYSQQRAIVNNEDICIVGAFQYYSQNMMATTSDYYNDFTIIAPIQGPEGVQFARYSRVYPVCQWFVTKDCANPEMAVRVGDFLFTDEARILNRFGLEGDHYILAKEGDVCCFSDYEPVLMQTDAGINLWSEVQNIYWRNNCPGVVSMLVNSYVWNGDVNNGNWRIGQGATQYAKYVPEEGTYLPLMLYTEDESYEISDLKTTILSYADESKARFITGDLDIENDWDAYLSELENIGLRDYLDMLQGIYDRQN